MIITVKFKSTKAFDNRMFYETYEYDRPDIGTLLEYLGTSMDMDVYVYPRKDIDHDPIASRVRRRKGYIVESTNAWRYRHENHR